MFDELVALEQAAPSTPPWSLRNFCTNSAGVLHEPQYAVARDQSQFIHLMCARQSGKSQIDDGMLIDNAKERPGSTNILLGLNGVAARFNNWTPVLKPMLDRYGFEYHKNEQTMLVTLPNTSRILLAGTDDLTHVKNILGNRFDGGLFILDEAQDCRDEVLKYIIYNMLPPTLTPTARVVLSGVFPEVPVGEFWRLRNEGNFSRHSWARVRWKNGPVLDRPVEPGDLVAVNVFTPEAPTQLCNYLRDTGISVMDPQIQRDWFGVPVFDKSAPAYRYDVARNGYKATPPAWLESWGDFVAEHRAKRADAEERKVFDEVAAKLTGIMASQPFPGVRWFSGAIDLGGRDRVSVQVWGWGENAQTIQHVFDWSSTRGAYLPMSAVMLVAAFAERHIGVGRWRYDTNSQQNIDTVRRDYGIAVIRAAMKADFDGQVDKMNDLLTFGRAKVMIGSTLEEDYQRARFSDKYKAGGGGNPWAGQWHPDPSEAARYAAQDYWDAYKPAPPAPDPSTAGFPDETTEKPWYERDIEALLGQ